MSFAEAYSKMNLNEHEWLDRVCAEISALYLSPDLDKVAVLNALSMMKATMLLHYAEEESLMRKLFYPNAGVHKRSHDYFMTEVSAHIVKLAKDDATMSGQVWIDFRHKLDIHVKTHDEVLAKYLEANPAGGRP